MPKATVATEAVHFNLKSCEGGWVKLRPLTYGQSLHRVDRGANQVIEGRDRKTGMPTRTVMETMIEATRQYEFKMCVVDHNLEDDQGAKLNFDLSSTFEILDPRIGAEIGDLIDKLNGDDMSAEDFFKQLGESQEADGNKETNTTTTP